MEALADRRPLLGNSARCNTRRLHARRLCTPVCQSQPSSSKRVSEREWQSQLQPGTRRVVPLKVAPYSSRSYNNIQETAESFSVSLTAETQTTTSASPQLLRELLERWEELPGKYKLVFATSLSFVVCNMDKVNISVAIIPMAQEFGWSPTVIGLVQSSFFWGYMLSQIPGGYVTSRLGGRKVLPAGVSLWSAATAGVPLLAGTVPGLCLSRAAVGLGEGVAPSAATDMVAKSIDKSERARAISFIFGGLHIGSLLGLLVAPPLIENFGWESVFYLFGGVGLAWTLYWEYLISSIREKEPELLQSLEQSSAEEVGSQPVPWRAILRTKAFWALAFTHFCHNWFHYTFLAWLPAFYTDSLSLDLTHAAHMALLPPIAAVGVSAIAGTSADALVARGVPTNIVRKLAQCVAFLTPAACLTGASMSHDGPTTVALITAGLASSSCSLAGLYCNHADLSPRLAPFLLGMTNTAGSIPGVIGVAITGIVLDKTDSWALALFAPSIFFFLAGSAVFTLYGSTQPAKFDQNEPFEIENKLRAFFGSNASSS